MTTGSGQDAASERLASWRLAVFGLPGLGVAMAMTPLGSVLPTIYATQAGIGLTAIGTVVFAGRIVDALVDPVIASVSDRTKSPWGRRKPWIALGATLLAFCIYFLFWVPKGASIYYFCIWYVLASISWSFIEIPYRAWGVELSHGYVERARVATFVGIGSAAGPLIFLGLPFLASFGGAGALDAPFLRKITWVIMALLAVGVPMCLLLVRKGRTLAVKDSTVKADLKAIFSNRPLRLFVLIFIFGGLGGGLTASLIMLYMKTVMGIEGETAKLLLGYSIMHMLGAPLVYLLVKRFDKRRVWAISWLASALILPMLALVPPGPEGANLFIALVALRGFVSAADTVVPMSMLGDVVDYDVWKTGSQRAANFAAVLTLILKFNAAISTAVGFVLLGSIGFNAVGPNTPSAILAFKIIFCFVPPALYVISCSIVWWFPIDRRRHSIIRRRIEQRSERLKSVQVAQPDCA